MQELICTAGQTEGCISILLVMRVLVATFLAVLFLQSGVDKVVDRKGNIEWLTGHFANSPFKNVVPLILTQVTLMEITAGILCAVGAVLLLVGGSALVALGGVALSALTLICLFLGQRLAKDYVGAAVLVNYFVLTILGLYLFTL